MDKKGLEIIYKTIAKTSIKEVIIKTPKGTELKLVRSQEEIDRNLVTPTKSNQEQLTNPSSIALTEALTETKEEKHDLISPEVGFFNRFDPRTKKQYVKLRDSVQKGQVVGTIISMHIHHQVIADQDGKVVEFLVEQDQPVVYNQPLIRLAPPTT